MFSSPPLPPPLVSELFPLVSERREPNLRGAAFSGSAVYVDDDNDDVLQSTTTSTTTSSPPQ